MHSDIVKPMYLQSDERETVIRVGGYKEISQGKNRLILTLNREAAPERG